MDHQRKLLSIFVGYTLCYKDRASRLIHVILILTTFLVGWINTFEFKDHPPHSPLPEAVLGDKLKPHASGRREIRRLVVNIPAQTPKGPYTKPMTVTRMESTQSKYVWLWLWSPEAARLSFCLIGESTSPRGCTTILAEKEALRAPGAPGHLRAVPKQAFILQLATKPSGDALGLQVFWGGFCSPLATTSTGAARCLQPAPRRTSQD